MTEIRIIEIVVSIFAAFGAISTLIAGIAMIKERINEKDWFQTVSDCMTLTIIELFLVSVIIFCLVLFFK